MTRAIERICSRSFFGLVHEAPSVPSPPACDTALASGAAAPGPSGACISGDSQPSALTSRAYPARSAVGADRSERGEPVAESIQTGQGRTMLDGASSSS